jgi:hypothetical protein
MHVPQLLKIVTVGSGRELRDFFPTGDIFFRKEIGTHQCGV